MTKNKKQLIITALFLFFTLFLNACGFHMSSKAMLSPQLFNLYYAADKPYEAYAIKFKKELKSYGVNFTENAISAPYVLHVYPTEFTSKDTSSGPSTQARIYNLIYKASFSITDKTGKTVVPIKEVTSTKDLTLGPNEIFDVSTLVSVTKQTMEQELVVKSMNILSSKQVSDAMAQNH
jgi:outer membrane lipopolysaccharide assembly protein LptE/RlpB